MWFSKSWVPHEDEVFRTAHVAPQGQLQNEGFGDILHRGKIVIGQFLDEWELCSPDGRLDALGISIRHLGLTETQQKLLRRETIACGISRIDLVQLKERGETQCTKMGEKSTPGGLGSVQKAASWQLLPFPTN